MIAIPWHDTENDSMPIHVEGTTVVQYPGNSHLKHSKKTFAIQVPLHFLLKHNCLYFNRHNTREHSSNGKNSCSNRNREKRNVAFTP